MQSTAEVEKARQAVETAQLVAEAERKRLTVEAEKARQAVETAELAAETEQKRLTEKAEKAQQAVEAAQLAAEAEQKRLAEEAEQALRTADAEGKRLTAEAEKARQAVETARLAAEARQKRLAEETEQALRAAEAERKRLTVEAEEARQAVEAAQLAAEAERKQLTAEAGKARKAIETAQLVAEAEQTRLAEEVEQALRTAEAARIVAETERARQAAEAEQARQAAEEERLAAEAEKARLAAEADFKRKLAEMKLAWEAEQKRKAEEAAKAALEAIPDVEFGKYYALVIGNNEYEFLPDLQTAEADAKAVAKVLRDDYAFEVELLLNANRRTILRSLAKLRRKLTEEDNLLVYYGGHGILDQAAERGYWLPVDAEEGFDDSWISNARITDQLKAINAWHVLVMADSCYSGAILREAGAPIESGGDRKALLERLAIKKSRTVMSSGGLEPVADGGGSGHSVFAKAFLSALADNRNVMETQRLFTVLREKVAVNADQTPEYADVRKAGHDGGDFIFVRKR